MYRDQQRVQRGKVGVDLQKEAVKRREAAVTLRVRAKVEVVEKRRKGGVVEFEEGDDDDEATLTNSQSLHDYLISVNAPKDQRVQYATVGVDPEKEALRRREAAISLRAKTRDEIMRDKRLRSPQQEESDDEDNNDNIAVMEYLPEVASALIHGSRDERLQAAVRVRKLLSKDINPPINEVIKSDCIPILVQFLGMVDDRPLQFEAAWALTNIASGTSKQTLSLIQAGGIPYFIRLLSSQSEDLCEQSVWALGNIAGDSARCRDLILHSNVVQPLIEVVHRNPRQHTLRNTAWCISNLLRGKNPLPDFSLIHPILPTLQVLLSYPDEDVVADTCWSLSFLADGPEDRIDAVIQLGVVPRIVSLLELSYLIQIPALRAAGNIVAGGNDHQTQSVCQSFL